VDTKLNESSNQYAIFEKRPTKSLVKKKICNVLVCNNLIGYLKD